MTLSGEFFRNVRFVSITASVLVLAGQLPRARTVPMDNQGQVSLSSATYPGWYPDKSQYPDDQRYPRKTQYRPRAGTSSKTSKGNYSEYGRVSNISVQGTSASANSTSRRSSGWCGRRIDLTWQCDFAAIAGAIRRWPAIPSEQQPS
jgi:hypothetical protein